jgi:POT family proton-dependent oligopeptide transporter
MVRQLLHPGHIEHIAGFNTFRAAVERAYGAPLSTVALASAIFGLYTGVVYLTPIAGGIIADRWLGRTRTITIGALLMAAGHFLMAFEVSFLIALLCLLTGVGCFKGNIASQVGALYAPSDLRRADAFQIYFLFINGAVIVAPLIAGTLGEVVIGRKKRENPDEITIFDSTGLAIQDLAIASIAIRQSTGIDLPFL